MSLSGTEMDGDSEAAVKRRKLEKAEGEELIAGFLEQVKAMPVSDMSEEEVMRKLQELKQQVLSRNNTFVADVLARGS